ncbi:RrF2 family transcriptional regulator [Sunxiuqinia elliptica]|uniref:BadM/Rrf2 family transcriptional regulator n=1 Tax=Sunxiuqinia elliptica TaxID=655355 RepID=A0A4R6H8S9_9BACT|nr:Rrf2 family transcriptional regulator [Sunxiuqinia elliptica]TDO04702.1 BadM/Rrf2 family transcriptional regulator [Sunxiuqinia elliptica]TDO64250.1 BadM/Rrf2 family transcriptional regulator [Sunxiuqinia elliptica]
MLSKSAEYAIRALVYIQLQNWEEKRPGYREIAREIESPEHFTAKILQVLTRFNFINSMKGRNGGFAFNAKDEPLKLYRVIVAIDGEKAFTRCSFGFKSCDSGNKCPLHDEFSKIRNDFTALVNKETIQSLAKKIQKGEAVLTQSIS